VTYPGGARGKRVILFRNSHKSKRQNNSRLLRRRKAGLNSISSETKSLAKLLLYSMYIYICIYIYIHLGFSINQKAKKVFEIDCVSDFYFASAFS